MSMAIRESVTEFRTPAPWRLHAAAFHDAMSNYRGRYMGMRIGNVTFESETLSNPFADVYQNLVFDVTASLMSGQNKPAMVRLSLRDHDSQTFGSLMSSHLRGATGKDMFDVAWAALRKVDSRLVVLG